MSSKIDTGYDNKQVAINMFFSVIVFIFNLFISFFITPYITSNLGSDAYGFVKLANDFTSYASLATTALNSMASRFIMLEREKNNKRTAQKYYSSITIANFVLSGILLIPATICVIFLNQMINVPTELLNEVRVTFILTFITFLINLAFSTYSNCYYLTNRLDISSIRSVQSSVLRIAVILLLYYFFSPRITYLVIGSFISTLFLIASNLYYHKKINTRFIF